MNWEDRTADYYIQRMFRQWDMADFASEMEVERVYRRLAGDLIGRLTQRVSFKKGILRLKYMSAALRQEMTYRRESLRQTMNDELGGDVVKKIIIS
ncbi:MAG: DUF721 domain-containing protein [Bacteroidales bacterium]|nr:DUF721 domain-containing protein [Bacteroidales bacterium]